ncbi:hypothetical protein [Roseivirga seohaensis]|uniref:hypothetical protein n=1 Tax=Roseivirga seohaensis TaxID=1914963 RepID=UPI003BA9648F
MLPTTIFLSDDEQAELERLAALGYTVGKMAMYFGLDEKAFIKEAATEESEIHFRIERGKLRSEAAEKMKILEAAERGNVTASQQLRNLKRDRSWDISLLDIFGAADDEAFLRLQDYLENGSSAKLSDNEEIYLDALNVMVHMDRKYGRRNTIAYFVKQGLKHARAAQMYDEAISLFYIDRNIENKALRNRYADQLDEAARLVLKESKSSKDLEIYGNLIAKAAKIRGLEKDDPAVLPVEAYNKPVRFVSLDPADIGLPPINRNALLQQIEELDIPGKDQTRIKKEAMLLPFNLIERLDELKEDSKEI